MATWPCNAFAPAPSYVVMDYTQRLTPRASGLFFALFASVRGRIIFGFAFLVMVLVAVVSLSAWLSYHHDQLLNDADRDNDTVPHLQSARLNGADEYGLVLSYLLSGDESTVDQMKQAQDAALAQRHWPSKRSLPTLTTRTTAP